jgi:hypothetical protein
MGGMPRALRAGDVQASRLHHEKTVMLDHSVITRRNSGTPTRI